MKHAHEEGVVKKRKAQWMDGAPRTRLTYPKRGMSLAPLVAERRRDGGEQQRHWRATFEHGHGMQHPSPSGPRQRLRMRRKLRRQQRELRREREGQAPAGSVVVALGAEVRERGEDGYWKLALAGSWDERETACLSNSEVSGGMQPGAVLYDTFPARAKVRPFAFRIHVITISFGGAGKWIIRVWINILHCGIMGGGDREIEGENEREFGCGGK